MPLLPACAARVCLVVCSLVLAAAPAWAQHKISVTPATINIARGSVTSFDVQKDVGQGWQASTPDEWYTLVEPAKLGVFKVVAGKLVFEAEMEGTGELHVWHKTKLSGSGLYTKVPVTVRGRAAPVPPVRPTPPVPPTPVPANPVPTPATNSLDVFRLGALPPVWIDPTTEIAIAPGESLSLVAIAPTPGRALDLVPAGEPGLTARVEGGRVIVELNRGTPVGTRIELSLRCRATNASTRLRFVAGAAAPAPTGVRVWIRRGFDGAWLALAADGAIALRPGGVVFISAEAVSSTGRPAIGAVELALPDSTDFGLRSIGPGLWLLASGASTRFDVKGAITAKVAGTAVTRTVSVAFGE